MADLKITVADKKRIDEAAAWLTKEREKLEDAISVFNEAVNAARNALSIQIDAYNEAQVSAYNLMEDIHREQEEALDGRSEKWLDSEKGEAAKDWVQNLENIREALSVEVYHSIADPLNVEELLGEEDPDEADISSRLENLALRPSDE
jgi:hypothetical protein